MSAAGYMPLPSDPPPAYAPGPANSGYTQSVPVPASSADYKDLPQSSTATTVSAYAGSYQGGAPYGVYCEGSATQAGYYQPTHQGPYVNVLQSPTSVVIIGGCPACRVGVLEDEYSCLGICCAIVFFPVGLLCCLAMKQRHCPNCGAVFG